MGKRFKPEQIARFGNNYVIYPSLSKMAYQRIIETRLDAFCESANEYLKDNGFSLFIDGSINSMIYDNGVYPAQGARPILSTIDNFINNIIPKVIITCEESDYKGEVVISSTPQQEDNVVFKFGDKEEKIPFVGELDKIRKEEQVKHNTLANVSVHESGHALVHCLVFGVTPKTMKVGLASSTAGGFIYNSITANNKSELENRIRVLYAGRAAELVVFGAEHISTGASHDYSQATNELIRMSRSLGMYGEAIVTGDNVHKASINDTESDEMARKHANRLMADTIRLVTDNQDFLRGLSTELLEKKELSPIDMANIAKKYGNDVIADNDSKDDHYEYAKAFTNWVKNDRESIKGACGDYTEGQ